MLTAVPESNLSVSGPLAAAPTGQFLFGGDSGINVGKIDRATGELTPVPGSPFGNGVIISAMAVTQDEHFLFVLAGTSLYTYSIDGDIGALTPAGPPISSGGGYLTVSSSNQFLYVSDSSQFDFGALERYSINPRTGVLTGLELNAYGSAAVITPNGKYLYTIISAEGGPVGEYFYSYAIDAGSGILTALPPGPIIDAAVTEQTNLAIDPTGRFLYETVENPPGPAGVAGFLIDPINGEIEAIAPGSPFTITDGYPTGIVIDHSGHFLYMPNNAANVLNGFALNTTTGSLRPIVGTSPQIAGPHGIATAAPSPASTATVTSLAIEPIDPSLLTGQTSLEQFIAAGTYSDGSHRFLTASVTWSSGTTNVATISNTPGQSGLATIFSSGSTVIEATLNGLSAKTTLTVEPATLVSIAITPAAPGLVVDTAIQFAATGTYGDGTMKDITDAVGWKSTNASVAAINQSALAKGNASGTTTIEAASGKVVGSTILTVVAAAR